MLTNTLFSFCQPQKMLSGLLISVLSSLAISLPVKSAEEIYFVYDSVSESLSVESLETFAEDGTIDKELAFYLRFVKLSPEEQALFREALTKKIDINPVILSRLLNTDEGERLLDLVGKVINLQGGRNGKFAIRGALVQAAFDPEGLTLLNFFKKLGVNVSIDLKQALILGKSFQLIADATKEFVVEVAALSAQEIEESPPIDYSQLPDIREKGQFSVKETRWNLVDTTRDRKFYVLVYQPTQWREGKTPVVIISHGLTAQPSDHAEKAKHLASYGFVVVLPQHSGSDDIYAQEFKEGIHRDISDVNEFINRPLDIRYTINELERRNSSEFEGRLDLENIGMWGHSFGSYTALAVSIDAQMPNFEQLEEDCASQLRALNTALLLECRALKLERKTYNFRDRRIKAVIATNPVNASILGEKGMSNINIPVGIGAGSYDPATPFVFEQVRSFPWLTATPRYLFLEEGQAHIDFSQVDGGTSKIMNMIPSLQLPSPELLSAYSRAVRVAFFEVHIAKNEDYLPYLSPAYAEYLSQGEEFKAYMITEQSSAELIEAINNFKREHGL
ncbi:MAG: alpha/beta hydrolase [Microcystaceae cyanobacterium]